MHGVDGSMETFWIEYWLFMLLEPSRIDLL